jgi:hypothetical protein
MPIASMMPTPECGHRRSFGGHLRVNVASRPPQPVAGVLRPSPKASLALEARAFKMRAISWRAGSVVAHVLFQNDLQMGSSRPARPEATVELRSVSARRRARISCRVSLAG